MHPAHLVIPRPLQVSTPDDPPFTLAPSARICAAPDAQGAATVLADFLRSGTSFKLPLTAEARPGDIALELSDGGTNRGASGKIHDGDDNPEAYTLSVREDGIRISATAYAGLFNGIQTLRQLFPAAIEQLTWAYVGTATTTEPQATAPAAQWTIPAVDIRDAPRFPYRGLMLDVARSFFTVDEVKQQIDTMSQLKLNALHLHLTDDQAWRIEILNPASNPSGLDYNRLATIGGQGAVDHPGVGLSPGHPGYYTQEDFRELVEYAAARNVVVVPEIDLPGHVNAALAAIPELNPDGVAKVMNTSGEVGYSTLDAGNPVSYEFAREVLGQVAAITPGPYLHIGGDEALVTGHDNYVAMVAEFSRMAAGFGKSVVGWNEYAEVGLPAGSVIQYWHGDMEQVRRQATVGARVIMSPAATTYLDQRYDGESPIGLSWVEGGPFTWAEYYQWDPEDSGLPHEQLLGVEGPLWTETVRGNHQAAWLTYPRAVSLAEVGWSQQDGKDVEDFRRRLGAFGGRLARQGVPFQAAPDVDWAAPPPAAF